jgi:tetratricopeptide (TPR) repeat protein
VKAFISHASADKLIFRACAATLKRSGVEVWDYLGVDETNVGELLERELFEHIRDADFVVSIITNDSLQNDNVKREIEIARDLAKTMFSLVVAGAPPHTAWEQPFDVLAPRVFEVIGGVGDVERGLGRVLSMIGVRLRSAIASHPRLPVRERTVAEIDEFEKARRANSRTPQSLYNAIVVEIDKGNGSYCAGNYRKALASFGVAAMHVRSLLDGFEPYYLTLATTVCLIHQSKYTEALAQLESVGDDPRIDESWFAAKGMVFSALGDRDAAKKHFLEALEITRRRGEPGFAALVNLVQFDPTQAWALSVEDGGLTENERAHVRYLRAYHAFNSKQYAACVAELSPISVALWDEDIVTLVSEAYSELDDLPKALAVVDTFIARTGAVSKKLGRVHARRLLAGGDPTAAARMYASVLAPTPQQEASLWIEYARVLRMLRHTDRMREVCLRLIDCVKLPIDAEAAYSLGLAHYLVGNSPVAAFFYGMASEFGGRPYEDVVKDDEEVMRVI